MSDDNEIDVDLDNSDDACSRAVLGPHMDRSPGEIEQQVLAVSLRSPLDDLCAAIDAADWLLARAKTIHQLSRQIAINWIDLNGEFDIGNLHYHVGHNIVMRCTDVHRCGHRLLDMLQGDLDGFLGILCAQPFKSGAAKRVLTTADYRSLFAAKAAARLVAGVPERVLKRVDKRFTAPRG